jgi:hypothetical protein
MVTNSGEPIPDASIIVRFGRGPPGGQGVAGSNPVSPTVEGLVRARSGVGPIGAVGESHRNLTSRR